MIAKGVTVAGATTLVYIRPSTTASMRILRCWVSQNGTTTSEQEGVALYFQPKATGTLTGATPFQHGGISDAASSIVSGTSGAAGTAGINASAEGTGTITYGPSDAFNNLNGWLWVPTPDEAIVIAASSASGFGLMLTASPTSKTLWNAGVTWAEIG